MTKYFQIFLGLGVVFMGCPLLAAVTDPVKLPTGFDPADKQLPVDSSRFMGEFMYMLFILGCLIGLMMFASWFIRRMMHTKVQQMNESSNIKITESRSLGPKSILHLIEVNGTEILVSETPAGVTPLAKFRAGKSFDQMMDSASQRDMP